jgi:hypothetical protein
MVSFFMLELFIDAELEEDYKEIMLVSPELKKKNVSYT